MNLEDINRFLILRFLRKIYFFLDKRSAYRMIDIGKPGSYKPLCDRNIENVSNLIYDMLQTDKPCMIARFGNTEMSVLANQYEIQLGNQDGIRGVLDYIQGKRVGWWIIRVGGLIFKIYRVFILSHKKILFVFII